MQLNIIKQKCIADENLKLNIVIDGTNKVNQFKYLGAIIDKEDDNIWKQKKEYKKLVLCNENNFIN